MINRVYKLILFLLNKENKGYITPEEFNELAEKVQLQIITDLFVESNKAAIRSNRGSNNIKLTDNELTVNQKLTHLVTSSSVTIQEDLGKNIIPKPSDLWFVLPNGVSKYDTLTGIPQTVDRGDINQKTMLLNTGLITAELPMYFDVNSKWEIVPPITGDVDVMYLRKPKKPKWTYRMIKSNPSSTEETPMYNPSDPLHQDFDLHEAEFSNVVLRMLPELGLSLRETEVIEYGERLKQNEEITDNYQ